MWEEPGISVHDVCTQWAPANDAHHVQTKRPKNILTACSLTQNAWHFSLKPGSQDWYGTGTHSRGILWLPGLPVSHTSCVWAWRWIFWTQPSLNISRTGPWRTRKFLPNTRWNLRWRVGGKFFGVQMCTKQARIFRREISPQILPLEKQNLATSLPWPKSKFRRFRPKCRHVQNHHFHHPLCLVPPLSQPHWLVLPYISKPSIGGYLLFWLCKQSWNCA